MDLSDPHRILTGVSLAHQARALDIGLEHDIQEAGIAGWHFLEYKADAGAPADTDGAIPAAAPEDIFSYYAQERRLAGPVASDKADFPAVRNLSGCALEKRASVDPERQVIDL